MKFKLRFYGLERLGERIKELRQRAGMTQDELAKKLGYTSRSTINKIEKGLVDIPQSKIQQLATLFNVDIPFIIGYDYISGKDIVNEYMTNTVVVIKDNNKKYYKLNDEDFAEVQAMLKKYDK